MYILDFISIAVFIQVYYFNPLSFSRKTLWTFLLGTHPRLGEDSPVRSIAYNYPVLRKIVQFLKWEYQVKYKINLE